MTLPAAVQRIYLIGPRWAGKTTVGRLLAARLGWDFEDSDAAVAHRSGRTAAQWFQSAGESAFRDTEAAVLQDLAGRQRCVIATGGGAVLRATNRELLRSTGLTVFVTAGVAALRDRLAADAGSSQRPPLTDLPPGEEIARVLGQREPLYREAAHVVVDTTGQTPNAVVDAILAAC
jgi:shikimate kinase